jgi:hypothetical protein
MTNRSNQQALLWMPREDRRSRNASLENGRSRVKPQIGLLFIGAMAFVAGIHEDRPNLTLKVINNCRRFFGRNEAPNQQRYRHDRTTPQTSGWFRH